MKNNDTVPTGDNNQHAENTEYSAVEPLESSPQHHHHQHEHHHHHHHHQPNSNSSVGNTEVASKSTNTTQHSHPKHSYYNSKS